MASVSSAIMTQHHQASSRTASQQRTNIRVADELARGSAAEGGAELAIDMVLAVLGTHGLLVHE